MKSASGYATGTMARNLYLPCPSILSELAVWYGAFGVLSVVVALSGRKNVRQLDVSSREEMEEIECCSPLSSVSHVSMTAPGMGSLLEVSTRPSKYMYSPFPSDAIDSPSGTVGVTGTRDGDEVGRGDGMAKTRIEPTFWCATREEWPQDAALRRLPTGRLMSASTMAEMSERPRGG